MENCIETQGLTKRFPVVKGYSDIVLHPLRKKEVSALRNVDIEVRKGEIFGLLGPNGAGKTTLIKILCTLVLPTSGKAYVEGLDVTTEGKRVRKRIGYVIGDERSFYWRLTGRQNLMFFAELNNLPTGDAEEVIDRLLSTLELTQVGDRMFKDYSTGMRQKLAIARGLLIDPAIIFMDEPTNGLDPGAAQNLRRLIREKLSGEDGRTVVYATHNLKEAEELCHSVGIIHKGEIRMAGKVADIRKKFKQGREYRIHIGHCENALVERIKGLHMVKSVTADSVHNGDDEACLDIEIHNEIGSTSRFLKEVIGLGAEVRSFAEKEISLEELFFKIIETEEEKASL